MSTTSQVVTPKHNTKRKMKTIAHAWLITILRWHHTYPNFTVGKAIIVRLASCVGVVFRTVFSVISGCTSQTFGDCTTHKTPNFFKFSSRSSPLGLEKKKNLNSRLSFLQARRTYCLPGRGHFFLVSVNRELKQRRPWRLGKRHLKDEFALPITLSRLFHLV